VSIRDALSRLRTTTEELDRRRRAERRAASGSTPISEVADRQLVDVMGEVQSVRIVPRAGAPTIDVTIDDGHGVAMATFYGRRSIPGVRAGTTLRVRGRASLRTGRATLINPEYELVC